MFSDNNKRNNLFLSECVEGDLYENAQNFYASISHLYGYDNVCFKGIILLYHIEIDKMFWKND